MIPKIIHYVWLGGKDKSKLGKICIQNWEEKLTDYEIIEWNETRVDLDAICSKNRFFAECRKRKLWAFMADYLRLKILYENGGIYFDTDIQVIKPFGDLLNREILVGYEKDYAGKLQIGTGVIGCEKGNPLIKQCLDFYDNEIWNVPYYTIPRVMEHVLNDSIVSILPCEYLTPFAFNERIDLTELSTHTYTVHWFEGTWSDKLVIRTFLKTKHIKNPIKHRCAQLYECFKFYTKFCQRIIKRKK